MSAINSITESWNNHTFQEVESHLKGNYAKSLGIVTANTNITDLGVGMYTTPYRHYINGAPEIIEYNDAIGIIRMKYTKGGGEDTMATIVFDLENARICVRHNDTDATWKTVV